MQHAGECSGDGKCASTAACLDVKGHGIHSGRQQACLKSKPLSKHTFS